MKLPTLCIAVSLVGSVFSQSAAAQTAITNFDVTITIENACIIVSAENLDFGTVGTLTSIVNDTADLVVNCTSGALYQIALDAGQGGGTTATRVMTSGSDTVGYQLYSEAGRTSVWGVDPEDVESSTGTGADQTFTVYGQVPIQNTPPAATYTDTIGVTVTF